VAEEGQRFEVSGLGLSFSGTAFRNGKECTTPVTNAACQGRDRASYQHVDLASILTGYRSF
jgi:hypothetical protein